MAVSDSLFETETKNALIEEVNTWVNNQKDALDEVAGEATGLDDNPPLFKAAAWMGMAGNAVQTIFADSKVTATLKGIAVPLGIIGYAVELFKSHYTSYVDKFNAMITGDYISIKNELRNDVDHVGRTFMDAHYYGYGQYILAELRDVLKKRQKNFGEKWIRSYVRSIIAEKDHGIIEEDNIAIGQQTREGFGALCEKLKMLYQGTEDAWGVDQIRYFNYNVTANVTPVLPFTCPYDPKLGKKSCLDVPQQYVVHDNDFSPYSLGWIAENIWKMEVKMRVGFDPLLAKDTVYVYEADNPPSKAVEVASDIVRGKFPDIRKNLISADEKLWAQRRS